MDTADSESPQQAAERLLSLHNALIQIMWEGNELEFLKQALFFGNPEYLDGQLEIEIPGREQYRKSSSFQVSPRHI